jgi:phospholipase/carboxylesterase
MGNCQANHHQRQSGKFNLPMEKVQMNFASIDCIEVNPSGKAIATIIWLHGLGADGHDFEPIVPELNLPDSLPVRFVFPHAPERAVTINSGMIMRAWFDIFDLDLGADSVDQEQFLESVAMLEALIEIELRSGLTSDRIVLAGFSQGGAVALHTGLHFQKPLAGILAMSMHLPTLRERTAAPSPVNLEIPIMMAHGQMDPLIPLAGAIATRQELTRLGYAVRWHEYPMEHSVCAEEVADIRAWLMGILG